jgi:hypothetical protein
VDITQFCAKPSQPYELDYIDPKTIAEIEAAGGRVLNPKPMFLSPEGDHYIVQSGGVVLYRDEQHLTVKGAELMLLPLLRDFMALEHF